MDIIDAWKAFARSGKINDYLKYKEIANEAEYGRFDNKGSTDG